MTLAIRELWDTLDHDLTGLTDDDLLQASQMLIERFGTTSPGHWQREAVLDELREGAGGAPVSPSAPSDFEVAEHVAEVFELYRRPTRLHPACIAAAQDGATACWYCTPLLHDDACDCEPCTYHWHHRDADDDVRETQV